MVIIFFDIIIIFLIAFIIVDIKRGFLLSLCCRIFMPHTIRFVWGGISISILDVFAVSLIFSFIVNKKEFKDRLPQKIYFFLLIDVVTTFILIFLSSKVVPIPVQLSSFVHYKLIGETLLYLAGYYSLNKIDIQLITNWLMTTSIICGLYGILGYITKTNPYMSLLSLTYLNEDAVALAFMDETRGFLSGRIMGTMDHPLSWGQFWNVIIPFCILSYNKKRNLKFAFFLLVGIINIFLCGSRSALMALLVFGLFIVKYRGIKNFARYCIIGLSLFFVVGILTPSSSNLGKYMKATFFFWDKDVADKADIGGSSMEMRIGQLLLGLDVVYDNMLGGYGYQLRNYLNKEETPIEGMLGYESIILSKLVEQGILGLIIYFYLFGILLSLIKSYKFSEGRRIYLLYGYVWSYLVAVIATGVQGVATFIFMILLFKCIADCDSCKLYSQELKNVK